MAAHVWWRALFAAPANYAAAEEFQMYDSAGVYLPLGGVATSSSSFGASFTADKAFDQDFTTFWLPVGIPPRPGLQWLQYQFPSPVDVATVRLVDREGGFGEGPSTVLIQYSDNGSVWTNATATLTPSYGGDGNATQPNVGWSFAITAPAPGFYLNWRVRPTSQSQILGNQVKCAELSIRGVIGGPNLADATRQYGLGVDDIVNAYDGNPATYCLLAAPGDATQFGGNWLGYAFSVPVRIIQACWTMPSSGGGFAIFGPVSIAVEGSNDGGVTWTTAWTGTYGTWTADGQTQCVSQLSISCGNPPNGTVGIAYTSSPVVIGAPPYTFSIIAGMLPNGLSIDASTGVISGTPTVLGTYNYTVQVVDSTTKIASVPCSIVILAPAVVITCGGSPDGTVAVPYSNALPASGGVPPYAFALLAGALPPGLSLDPLSGVISGTPALSGIYPFTASATDTLGNVGQVNCSITIIAASLAIGCGGSPTGVVGAPYSVTLPITGGTPPYTVTIVGGSLPPGLLVSAAGVIVGLPTSSGTFPFTVQVADSLHVTATVNCSITITQAVQIGCIQAAAGVVGVAYNQQFPIIGGSPPYTFQAIGGQLPFGLTLDPLTGIVSGVPVVPGKYQVVIQVTDAFGIRSRAVCVVITGCPNA